MKVLDVKLLEALDELDRVIHTPRDKEKDKNLCGALRNVFWRLLLVSRRFDRASVKDLYNTRIAKAADETVNAADPDSPYFDHITQKRDQMQTFVETGVLKLNEQAKKTLCEQYGEYAEHVIRLLNREGPPPAGLQEPIEQMLQDLPSTRQV